MDLELIEAHNKRQKLEAEERAKTEDMAFALTAILDSQKKIEKAIQQPLMGVVQFLKNYKPQVSVTNPQKIPDIQPVIDSLNGLLKEIKGQKTDLAKSVEKLAKSITIPDPLDKIEVTNQFDYSKNFDALKKAIAGIEVKPEAPKVTVKAPDLKPLQTVLAGAKVLPQFDLSTYHAQDLDEEEKDVQYVGFTNLDGYWYILRNDIRGYNMRYKFGKSNYPKAWGLAPTFKYSLLEKAINEIKT